MGLKIKEVTIIKNKNKIKNNKIYIKFCSF